MEVNSEALLEKGLKIFFEVSPKFVINLGLTKILDVMYKKHIRVFQKMSLNKQNTFIIEAIDLPYNFFLRVDEDNPEIKILEKYENIKADATLKAKLEIFLKISEGTLDGDAVFFSKDLIIEGNTASVVALRNAMEADDINFVKDFKEGFSINKEKLKSFKSKLKSKLSKIKNIFNYIY